MGNKDGTLCVNSLPPATPGKPIANKSQLSSRHKKAEAHFGCLNRFLFILIHTQSEMEKRKSCDHKSCKHFQEDSDHAPGGPIHPKT